MLTRLQEIRLAGMLKQLTLEQAPEALAHSSLAISPGALSQSNSLQAQATDGRPEICITGQAPSQERRTEPPARDVTSQVQAGSSVTSRHCLRVYDMHSYSARPTALQSGTLCLRQHTVGHLGSGAVLLCQARRCPKTQLQLQAVTAPILTFCRQTVLLRRLPHSVA